MLFRVQMKQPCHLRQQLWKGSFGRKKKRKRFVRMSLDVLASREFAGAPRLAKFLTFVVETALAGDADQIKESLIAVEVYGRRPDYNPQIDSTVRVEAGRLRARLRQYYEARAPRSRCGSSFPRDVRAGLQPNDDTR